MGMVMTATATPSADALAVFDVTESARVYLDAAVAPTTRRAYESDWRLFSAWCADRGLTPLPATPGTIVRYIVGEIDRGRTVATMRSPEPSADYLGRSPSPSCSTSPPEASLTGGDPDDPTSGGAPMTTAPLPSQVHLPRAAQVHLAT
jgi:hypothetical protein